MDQGVKKKWLAKLDGAKKARKRLRNKTGGRCCLGWLCDLYMEETSSGGWSGTHFYVGTEVRVATLPTEVRRWAEISGKEIKILAKANDTRAGFPIEEIEAL